MIGLDIVKLTGVLAAIWMLVGVVSVARMFPGYSHRHCVMSELGAVGRPTEKIHPRLNNYPLAVLFVIFGISIAIGYDDNWPTLALGLFIIVHGISHAVTGYFPCDEDLGIPKPSSIQIIHNVAGLVMLLSLIACAILGAISSSFSAPDWFSGFSLTCLVVSLVFLVLMAKSFKSGRNIGLYQRVSYGALVFWVAVFSVVAFIYA